MSSDTVRQLAVISSHSLSYDVCTYGRTYDHSCMNVCTHHMRVIYIHAEALPRYEKCYELRQSLGSREDEQPPGTMCQYCWPEDGMTDSDDYGDGNYDEACG